MTPPKRTRKPAISKEERLRALIASFSIEGIKLTMEEALAILKKVELCPGTCLPDRQARNG
jgi:hypothetical protein